MFGGILRKVSWVRTWLSGKNVKIDANNLSKKIENSILNTKFEKPNRLNGKKYSIKEAYSWRTEKWNPSIKRIVIWENSKRNLILVDWTHLLEAYRRLNKRINFNVFDFVNDEVKEKFLNLWKRKIKLKKK